MLTNDRKPVVSDPEYQEAIDRGDYTVAFDNYLTVWLNGDKNDAYELHRDDDEWRWEPSTDDSCEVEMCSKSSTGTVTITADLSDDEPVEWRLCGGHLAAVACVLFAVDERPLDV